MRQKDDKKFAELLNHLHTGAHTKKDIESLNLTKILNKDLANDTTIPHFSLLKNK